MAGGLRARSWATPRPTRIANVSSRRYSYLSSQINTSDAGHEADWNQQAQPGTGRRSSPAYPLRWKELLVVVAVTLRDGLDRQPGEECGREPGRDRHRGDQGEAADDRGDDRHGDGLAVDRVA